MRSRPREVQGALLGVKSCSYADAHGVCDGVFMLLLILKQMSNRDTENAMIEIETETEYQPMMTGRGMSDMT